VQNYVIVTDSTSDLPLEIIEQYEITVLPLQFSIGGRSYLNYPDERDYPLAAFYQNLRDQMEAKTSQVSYGCYQESFEDILSSGRDILYIGFSSALSGTYSAACLAADDLLPRYPGRNILLVDSLCASLGEGLLVYRLAQMRKAGSSLEEVYRWAMENRGSICHWFTVDDLGCLKRGGRISATAAFLGTALQIKPVLHVDDAGRLIPMEKVRGRAHALTALVDEMEKTAVNPQEQVVFISHGDCLQDAQTVARMVQERLGVPKVVINYVGPVIGSHSGPGTVALFFFGKHR